MSIDKDLLDRLMEVRSHADLFGKTGILAELTRALAERALSTEMDGQLGDDRTEQAPEGRNRPPTRIWAPRGSRPRAPRDTRYTWADIFGAVCPERGATAALVMSNARHAGHDRPPRGYLPHRRKGAHAVLVLDGARWHGAKALRAPDCITPLPRPPYAPELNPVENVRAYLRANRLAISVFETDEDTVARCCDAWNFLANDTATVRSITTREYAKAVRD